MSRRLQALLAVSLLCNAAAAVLLWRAAGGLDAVAGKLRQLRAGGVAELSAPPPMQRVELTTDRVSGLPGYASTGRWVRLPDELVAQLRPPLQVLSQFPSGGRIRFKTDASAVRILARSRDPGTPFHMNSIMKNGVDLYLDGRYWSSAWPDETGQIRRRFELPAEPRVRSVTVYLPLYEQIEIYEVAVPEGARILPADDLASRQPMIFYGSSITQGGVASNPGMSYPAILSRSLGIDFINLGFSGNGLGDPELARYIATLEASIIVLDFWANPSPELYAQTLSPFVEAIRARHRDTPILVVGPFYNVNREQEHREKRATASQLVESRQQAGDEHIHFFDGRLMLSRETAFGLTDGRHPNSLGFWFCAQALEPKLRELLELPAAAGSQALSSPLQASE
ncbi:MAG: SGNH/GDSL hydrolase family protein [Acidobacteriota bacterium]